MANLSESGFQNGEISLDEPRAVYYSGQTMRGKVEFKLDQPVDFRALTINFNGTAHVEWDEKETEEVNGRRITKNIKYSGHEEYFNVTQCLSGGPGISQLPPGTHSIPFQYQIPFIAPSSYNGEKGTVAYYVSAYLDYPDHMKPKEELMKEFELVAPLDLNQCGPEVKQPTVLEFDEEAECNCLCSSKSVSIQVQLPATGYCPGQNIPLSVDVRNDANIEVRKIIFQLCQRACYKSQRPMSDYIPPEKVLVTEKKGPVLGGSRRHFICDMLVPELIAPNLSNCSIIELAYFIKVQIQFSGCNDDVEDEQEITIGLVPLAHTLQGEYKHPMAYSLPNAPIPTPTNTFNYNPYPHNDSVQDPMTNAIHNPPQRYIGFVAPPTVQNNFGNFGYPVQGVGNITMPSAPPDE